MKLQIELLSNYPLQEPPKYATEGAAALDLHVVLDDMEKEVTLLPNGSMLLGTGIKVAIPKGYCGVIVPRSGTGSKGYHLKNVIGIIDSDYRGEVLLNIVNTHPVNNLKVHTGDRLAQMLILPVAQPEVEVVDKLDTTLRGEGGFGSTGV